jgi:hypothetical protein
MKGVPLIRVKPEDLNAAGAERVGRVTGAIDGKPQLAHGSVLDVANVIWCTGFTRACRGSTCRFAVSPKASPSRCVEWFRANQVSIRRPDVPVLGVVDDASGAERDAQRVADAIRARVVAAGSSNAPLAIAAAL